MLKRATMFAALLLAAACGDDDDDTINPAQIPTQRLDDEVRLAMDTAIQDEYRAEETYRQVLRDFGEVAPFTNIVNAEQLHSEALATLYIARGLSVPASGWNRNNVPRYASVREACAAGVVGEEENIALYDGWLGELDLPADVERVFTNLRDASRDNHLPAFERCAN